MKNSNFQFKIKKLVYVGIRSVGFDQARSCAGTDTLSKCQCCGKTARNTAFQIIKYTVNLFNLIINKQFFFKERLIYT
jgi:hypothetical protein